MQGPILAALLTLAIGGHTDTTLTVSPDATLELENFAGSIEVGTWTRNAVRIEASHGRRAGLNIDQDRDGIHIEVESRFGVPTSADFKLTVPVAMGLKLSGVNCDITVSGTKGPLELGTVQGDVTVTGGEGHITAESVQGLVSVEGASGRIEASSVNQGVKIRNVRGDLTAESVNGTISVENADVGSFEGSTVNGTIIYAGSFARDGRYEMSTHNGGIYVAVPADANLSVEAETYSGSFDTTFPINADREERRHSRTVLRLGTGSGAELNLESFQGVIVLHRPGEKPYEDDGKAHDRGLEKDKSRSNHNGHDWDEDFDDDDR